MSVTHIDGPMCRAGIEVQTQRTDWETQRGKERAGWMEGVALSHIRTTCKTELVGSCCTPQGAQLGAL